MTKKRKKNMQNDISQIFGENSLAKKSISVRAADLIRQKIVCGELLPGQHLKENDFADALGISKACVREAFLILSGEGLVVREANKATRVVEYSQKDIRDFYDYRCNIETMCLRVSMEEGTLPMDQLNAQVERMQALAERGETIDVQAYINADLAFHDLIVRASDNRWAIREWDILRSVMHLIYWVRTTYETNPIGRQNPVLHSQILRLAAEGNRDAAVRALAAHIENNKAIIGK